MSIDYSPDEKRTPNARPSAGRVRLMFRMFATIVLAIWLFSQCWLIWLFQMTLKKYSKTLKSK